MTLHDGHAIPQLGYGVWQAGPQIAEDVAGRALEVRLGPGEVEAISRLDRGGRIGPDPQDFA